MKSVHRPILIVEDDEVDAMVIRRAMQDLQVPNPLELRRDGLEALAYLRDPNVNEPCMMLVDINMPRMNGHELLAELKADPDLCHIPVVVLTTSREKRDVQETFRRGASGFMVKPVIYSEFVELMKKVRTYWMASELPD